MLPSGKHKRQIDSVGKDLCHPSAILVTVVDESSRMSWDWLQWHMEQTTQTHSAAQLRSLHLWHKIMAFSFTIDNTA